MSISELAKRFNIVFQQVKPSIYDTYALGYQDGGQAQIRAIENYIRSTGVSKGDPEWDGLVRAVVIIRQSQANDQAA